MGPPADDGAWSPRSQSAAGWRRPPRLLAGDREIYERVGVNAMRGELASTPCTHGSVIRGARYLNSFGRLSFGSFSFGGFSALPMSLPASVT